MRHAAAPFASIALLSCALVGITGCTTQGPATGSAPAKSAKVVPAVVSRMIEAHGGMDAWRSAPPVCFTEKWGEGPATRVTVEQGTRRVHQEMVGAPARMGWDGERAWGLDWKGAPPRMVAQLGYYFLNLPWLTMDDGVDLAEVGGGHVFDDTTSYATVMMTFDAGVGDTPRDTYELYIDPRTYILHACKYTMTYSIALPAGAERTPERMLIFDKQERVNGLLVPTHLVFYRMDRSKYAECTVSDWSFDQPFDAQMAAMPEGAVVDTTTP